MENKLPKLSKMILPFFFTITKGVKIKPSGIRIQTSFEGVMIEEETLNRYVNFMQLSNPAPLSYLYILAQRAHTSLMLHRDFTISIPGLVHIENSLKQIHEINFNNPFNLVTEVIVEAKDEGSLIPKFRVDFIQKGSVVAYCNSTYLAKRKTKVKRKKQTAKEQHITSPFYSETWDVPYDLGRSYAKASGDRNPIHSSRMFAKILGFKAPIAQGWYSVSRIVKKCEKLRNRTFRSIDVSFKSPVFLPSAQLLEMEEKDGGALTFSLRNKENRKLVLIGTFS